MINAIGAPLAAPHVAACAAPHLLEIAVGGVLLVGAAAVTYHAARYGAGKLFGNE